MKKLFLLTALLISCSFVNQAFSQCDGSVSRASFGLHENSRTGTAVSYEMYVHMNKPTGITGGAEIVAIGVDSLGNFTEIMYDSSDIWVYGDDMVAHSVNYDPTQFVEVIFYWYAWYSDNTYDWQECTYTP